MKQHRSHIIILMPSQLFKVVSSACDFNLQLETTVAWHQNFLLWGERGIFRDTLIQIDSTSSIIVTSQLFCLVFRWNLIGQNLLVIIPSKLRYDYYFVIFAFVASVRILSRDDTVGGIVGSSSCIFYSIRNRMHLYHHKSFFNLSTTRVYEFYLEWILFSIRQNTRGNARWGKHIIRFVSWKHSSFGSHKHKRGRWFLYSKYCTENELTHRFLIIFYVHFSILHQSFSILYIL